MKIQRRNIRVEKKLNLDVNKIEVCRFCFNIKNLDKIKNEKIITALKDLFNLQIEDDIPPFLLCSSCVNKILKFHIYYNQSLTNIKEFEKRFLEQPIKEEEVPVENVEDKNHICEEVKIEKDDIFAESLIQEIPTENQDINECIIEETVDNEDHDHTKYLKEQVNNDSEIIQEDHPLNQSVVTIGRIRIEGKITNERYPSGRYKFEFNCPDCSRPFNSKSGLKYHLKTHLIGNEIEVYVCDLCGKTVRDKPILKGHMKNVHMEKQMCHLCGKGFGTRYALRTHMLRHDPSRKGRKREDGTYNPYVCDLCSKSFVRITSLRYHVKRVHLDEKDKIYICDICGKTTGSTKSSLTQHIMIHHTERKREQCEICNRLVISAKRHYKLVHETTGVFPCPKCPKKLTNEKQLSHHVRMRHPDETQRHICPHCQKSYKHKHLMSEHIHAAHTGSGSYLYQCEFCNFEVNYRRNLLAHYRKMHTELYAAKQKERQAQMYGPKSDDK